MQELGNGLFVLSKGNGSQEEEVENKSVALKAQCHNTEVNLFAQKTGKFTYRPSFSFKVDYIYHISNDLLQFATPELTFIDANGSKKTITLSYSDFTRETTNYYLYEDENGRTHYLTSEKKPEEGWTKTGEETYTDTYYPFSSRFTQRNSSLEASVRYQPKGSKVLTEENCSFSRSLEWYAEGYVNLFASITIGSGGDKLKTAREYLEELFETIDNLVLNIDNKGNITKEQK